MSRFPDARRGVLVAAMALSSAAGGARAASVKNVEPDSAGPAKLLCASPYGGKGTEQIVAAGVLPDASIVLAGNANLTSLKKGKGRGFLLRLTVAGGTVQADKPVAIRGHIDRMKVSPAGNLCVLVDGAGVYQMRPGRSKPTKSCAVRGIADFGVDADGEIVVLHGARMTRYDRSWTRRKWSVTWHAHGGNRPGGMCVCPATGVAAVVGYGMTHTGREPWKDPYACGFDRAGKPLWKLWDPDPRKQVGSRHGGNGLMADTTGHIARAGSAGKILLGLYADGGNSVCTRDPADPDQPIDPDVYAGVYQRGPGHGFKGASSTSVVFRVDAPTGTLEKGTWMCAWLDPGRANYLRMADLAADETGRIYVVGNSASACPKRAAWYEYAAGYQGGGFLAVFDPAFGVVQCGAFQQTSMTCVAAGNGYVVAAGHVKPPDGDSSVHVHKPIQEDLAGGEADGYFMIFETGPHRTAAAPAKPKLKPVPQNVPKRLLAEAVQAAADGKLAAARAKLRYILARHAASDEAAEAKALLAKLEAAAATPKPAESKERQAARLLQQAENYLRNRLKPQARVRLERIVKDFPDTPQAKAAQDLLDEHFLED